MLNRRRILEFAKRATIGFTFYPLFATAAEPSKDSAREFIENLAEEALTSLTASDIDIQERRNRFRELMHRYFAFDAIAKWVLGRYWRRANDPQKKEYMALFEKLMVVTYADRFQKYAGEKMHVVKTEERGEKDVLVHSQLERPGGAKAIAVIWRVRQKADSYKIVDVLVEGLSLGITQQKEFASVIRQHNNNVEGLLSVLRKRVNVDT